MMRPTPRRLARAASRLAALLALAALSPAAAPLGTQPAPPGDSILAVTRAHVVDVERGVVLRDRTILVRGGRIAAVFPAARAAIPPGARVVDADGRWAVPGLWDMHAHVDAGAAWQFPAHVALGVTGLRDMGSALASLAAWRDAARGGAPAPRIVGAGPIVFGAGDDPDPRVALVRTPDAARRLVDSLAAGGAAFIKTYDWIPRDAYLALADAARARGLHLAGHLPLQVTPEEAIAAGQRSIEHFGNAEGGLLLHLSRERAELAAWGAALVGRPFDAANLMGGWSPARALRVAHAYDPRLAARLARRMAAAGVWLTPTLASARSWVVPPDSAFLRDPRRSLLPRDHRDAVDSLVVGWHLAPPSREHRRAQRRLFVAQELLLQDLVAGGVRILAGSDFAPWVGAYPGHALHDELRALVAAGLTPLQALRAATLEPARYFGALDTLGAIAPRRVADLVLLDTDPLRDIAAVTRVHAVVLRGRWLGPAERERLLERARAAAR